jgi:hypothetical protein
MLGGTVRLLALVAGLLLSLASAAAGAVCSDVAVPLALAADQPVDQEITGRICRPMLNSQLYFAAVLDWVEATEKALR